jgi:hypothetical protein
MKKKQSTSNKRRLAISANEKEQLATADVVSSYQL